jgi:hypothetical protein
LFHGSRSLEGSGETQLESDFQRSSEEELVKDLSTKVSRWYHDPTRISLLAFILSLATLIVTSIASTVVYFISLSDEKVNRSLTEIERIYDKDFDISLSKILDQAYGFMENDETKKLVSKERFEKFWANVAHADADGDADMLLIGSRLKAIAQCADVGDCDREELFSRFPEPVYQAIFFLREFVFLNADLAKYADKGDLDGWWMSQSTYNFLADYCAWAKRKFHVMNLWSDRYERLRSPGQPLPDPCFPRE